MPRKIAVLTVMVALMARGQVHVSAPQAGTACDSSALLAMTTATTTQVVALAAGKSIHICSFVVNAGGTTTAKLVQGTGTNCATGPSDLTPAFSLINGGSVSLGAGMGRVLKTNAGSALCVTNSAAVGLKILIVYTQY